MKKLIFTVLSCLLTSATMFAQIPNNSFENWTNKSSYENPDGWSTMNNTTVGSGVFTATKATPGTLGSFYLKLTSKTIGASVVNGIAVSGKLDTLSVQPISGFAYSQRPETFTGKWQHMIYGNSQGSVTVQLTRWDAGLNQRVTVATANQTLSGMSMSWDNFAINFNYLDGGYPDSCIIVLKASGANPHNNDYLWVDNLAFVGTVAATETQLFIPDTLAGPNYNLTMHKDSVQFFHGKISHTYSFNSYHYLGPTLIMNKGANVNITVNNQIGDTTTVHWHGLHVPAKWDGGPHTAILPGQSWNPQFTVMNNAATYWYHPHMHMKTAEQTIKGAEGLIIVRDPEESSLTLPRKYGVDDFPIIVQVQQYDALNQAMPLGMRDSTVLVNGARADNGYSVYASFPAQVVRLRLLNGSGERVINFGFTGNMQFYQIATDGGLLDTPFLTTRVRLAPGERAEILLNLAGKNGQTFYLMCYGSALPMGVQGGPTMPMPPGSPKMDSPLNGVDYQLLQINVAPQTSNPVTTIPSTLTTNTPYQANQSGITRTINITADNSMVMDGPFYFNDRSFNMMRVDYEIPLNNIEIWKLVNQTMVAHPFHIHDVQFYVIDRNGNPPGQEERGRKDVVLVSPGESVMFITKFEDFADTNVPYMYHCHILMHEDAGMMGQFIVYPSAVGIQEKTMEHGGITVYPNPATEQLQIRVGDAIKSKTFYVVVYDGTGKQITHTVHSSSSFTMDILSWESGLYVIKVQDGQNTVYKKIIKQ